jgi:regulatory protein
LAAKGLLSEARTAESVLRSQGARFGARRLRQTLQAKGLDAELVSSTLQKARATELERAREVWRRRFGTPAADATERARQMRFLAGRGFEGDVIRRVVQAQDDE